MNLKLTVAVLLITALPVFAQAQKPNAVIVTHAEARKVLETIKGDKAKTQIYCDMVKLGHEMAAADEKKTDELNQKMGELQKKLGPEYAALMEGFRTSTWVPRLVKRSVRCSRRSMGCVVDSNGLAQRGSVPLGV